MLSQGEPHDAIVNFDRHQIFQRHRAVSLLQHGFIVQIYISDHSNAEITQSTLICAYICTQFSWQRHKITVIIVKVLQPM